MANKISKISEATLLEIKKKSALYLPDNPSASGLTPHAIKQALAGMVVDANKSSVSEQNRIVEEMNFLLDKMFEGVYEALPTNLSGFEVNDKIILEDGSIYKFDGVNFIRTNLDIKKIEENLTATIARQDAVESSVSALLDNQVIEGIIATDIQNKLNAKEQEYAPRLNEVEAQLTQNTKRQIEIVKDNKNTQHSKRRPIVTFVTDDGSIEDWNKLKPLSETYSIPFVSAIIVNSLGMTQEQLLYLQNTLGWEIASHTMTHENLVTLTEEEIEIELAGSKNALTELGCNVKSIVYPHGGNDERVRRIAKKYYRCGARVANDTIEGVNSGIISSFRINRVALGSYTFESSNTLEYYKAKVDETVAKNGWLVFMIHPGDADHDETQQSYLEQTIQYIKNLNIDILTLDEGLDIFGNALEAGDYVENSSDGVVVTNDGQIANFPNNLQVISKVGLNNDTLITAYPKGVVSATTFLTWDSAGFPTSAGTLMTYRLNIDDDLSFQLWHDFQTDRMFKRRYSATGNIWGEWVEYALKNYVDSSHLFNVVNMNAFTSTQLITDYPDGKVTTFAVNSPGSVGFPGIGMCTTYRVAGNGWDRQEFRKYESNELWSRYVDSNGAWTEWVKISSV